MRVRLLFSVVQVTILLSMAAVAGARAGQDSVAEARDSFLRLRGRHAISLHAGLLSRLTVDGGAEGGNVNSNIRVTGGLATFSYAYWVSPEWNVGFDASVIGAESDVSIEAGTVTSKSAAVTSFLIGAAYYPKRLACSGSLRPYASVSVGSFLGSASNSRVGLGVVNESVSDAAFALRLLGGADLFFANRFKVGIALGYDFVADFDVPIGDGTNYGGPECSAGFGVLLGSGR